MLPDATDDLPLLAERLRLGLPLRGFDGREIPLRTRRRRMPRGDRCGPRAPAVGGEPALGRLRRCLRLRRARPSRCDRVRRLLAGDPPTVIAAKVTAVLVSAAVRASVIARGPDISPSALNRATLSWYEMSQLRRRELLDAGFMGQDQRRSA